MGNRTQPARQSRLSTRLLPSRQAGIQAFAKSTKAAASASREKDAVSSKKRKLGELEVGRFDPTAEEVIPTRATKVAKAKETSSRSLLPQSGLAQTAKSPNPVRSTAPVFPQPKADQSLSSSQSSQSEDFEILPSIFQDLADLNSSFLTALSLHFAHNAPCAPADLTQLLYSIEKIWKKRKVVAEDIRRILYIYDSSPAEPTTLSVKFRLCNYGMGKFCLERLDTGRSKNKFGPPFSEKELAATFSENLEKIWRETLDKSGYEDAAAQFEQLIPLAPIHKSFTPFTCPRVGRQRFLDLKAGEVKLKSPEKDQSVKREEATSNPKLAQDRRSGLLQRIQSKQLKQSKLPPPPSKEAILRRSAADRINDVVSTLILLRPSALSGTDLTSTSPQKKPYKLDILVQTIQDSMRTPISKQEVEACLDILAHPCVAGDWVSIVTVQKLKSVVLRSGTDVSPRAICAKVAEVKAWQ